MFGQKFNILGQINWVQKARNRIRNPLTCLTQIKYPYLNLRQNTGWFLNLGASLQGKENVS